MWAMQVPEYGRKIKVLLGGIGAAARRACESMSEEQWHGIVCRSIFL
jgi:hypothetical protein